MSQALEGKRVLLVDDDNDILISMQAAFEPTGRVRGGAGYACVSLRWPERLGRDLGGLA